MYLGAQNTNLTNSQVNELYKIVKQNDYLKERLRQTEKTLGGVQDIVKEQGVMLEKQKLIIGKTEELMESKEAEHSLALSSKDVEINRLKELADVQVKIGKKQARKSFWRGIAVGGVTVGVLGAATLIYLAH